MICYAVTMFISKPFFQPIWQTHAPDITGMSLLLSPFVVTSPECRRWTCQHWAPVTRDHWDPTGRTGGTIQPVCQVKWSALGNAIATTTTPAAYHDYTRTLSIANPGVQQLPITRCWSHCFTIQLVGWKMRIVNGVNFMVKWNRNWWLPKASAPKSGVTWRCYSMAVAWESPVSLSSTFKKDPITEQEPDVKSRQTQFLGFTASGLCFVAD